MKTILLPYLLTDVGLEELLRTFYVIRPEQTNMSREEILNVIEDCDALVSFPGRPVDKMMMDAAPKLKLIASYGVGYDHIDIKYAHSKGISIAHEPDVVTEPTAELAFGLMHAIGRKICEMDRKLRNQDKRVSWKIMDNLSVGLYGKTLGIIGMGRIGQALARRAVAGGMKIVYCQHHRLSAESERLYNATYLPLNELLEISDFVSLHAPATRNTDNLINRDSLSRMKTSAILINTARGSLVDEEALIEALENGIITGAALDVFKHEPHISPALLDMAQVVLSPHHGTSTMDARIALNKRLSQNIIHFFKGTGRVFLVK